MIQEILTYLIIGIAIGITAVKTFQQFRKKKEKAKSVVKHNCKSCPAECSIRDMAIPVNKKDLCIEIKTKSE